VLLRVLQLRAKRDQTVKDYVVARPTMVKNDGDIHDGTHQVLASFICTRINILVFVIYRVHHKNTKNTHIECNMPKQVSLLYSFAVANC